jgi:hypothetical protein
VLALDVDRDGNLFAGGNVGGALPGKVSAGNADAFVRKHGPGGAEIWTL